MIATTTIKHPRRIAVLAVAAVAITALTLFTFAISASAQTDPRKAAVTGFAVTPGSDPGELDITWDVHPDGPDEYRVRWAPSGEQFRRSSNANWNAYPTVNSHTVTGLTPGATYKVAVAARFDGERRSAWSEVVTGVATPGATPDYAAERADAVSLGDIADTEPTNRDDFVDNDDAIKYYRFSLSERRMVRLRIREMDYNANLYVESNDGTVIVSGEKEGDSKEVLNVTLEATGADEYYYVRVEAQEAGRIDYTFRYLTEPIGSAPAFSVNAETRTMNESIGADAVATASTIGATLPAAVDVDGDTLTYRMTGIGAGRFAFKAGNRQLQTKVGSTYDHEARSSYSVAILADDGNGGTATLDVTISIADQDEPPLAPAAPTVTASSDSTTSVDVAWTAPDNAGRPEITGYDLQYREEDSGGTWTDGPQGQTGNSATITGLTAGTGYEVQVRATNDEGDGPWSDAGNVTDSASAEDRVFTALSSGFYHTCGLRDDDSISCWGANSYGVTNPPEGSYQAIASGSRHTCAIAADGSISCWGWGAVGQTNSPQGTFKTIVSGSRHTCAIATDNTVACWGYDSFGQGTAPSGTYKALAIGWEHTCAIATDDTITCWGLNDEGVSTPPAGTFKAMSAGFLHTCAIATDGAVHCWGNDFDGRIEPPAGAYTSIASGYYHNCAVASDGTLDCWGLNGTRAADPPTGTYKSIFAELGGGHSCAISTDDTVVCWGSNSEGQATPPEGTYTSVVVGAEYTCAIASDGMVDCWGYNQNVQSEAPAGAYQAISFGGYHACAIASDDSIACWGIDYFGQSTAPTGAFKSLGAGTDHTCAIASDDSIACWGYNWDGQTDAPTGAFESLSVGADHTCAIAHSIACWGYNWDGQTDAPTGAFESLSVGADHTCAIASDDSIACWGYNMAKLTLQPALSSKATR